jgi:probable phosphoglycerate mutase
MDINVYTDGGARGNPGISGFGLVIYDGEKQIIHKQAKFLGIKTNNEAEYSALLAALEWIFKNKKSFSIDKINFFSDSQLMVRQMQGVYKVKSPNLSELFFTARKLLAQIDLPYEFHDIRRNFNKIADELANLAMDQKII